MAEVNVLDVLLYGEPIGTLTRAGERTIFAFTEAYIENESRPVLSLGFKDEFGELITEHKPSRIKLPPFFFEPATRRAYAYLSRRARRSEPAA